VSFASRESDREFHRFVDRCSGGAVKESETKFRNRFRQEGIFFDKRQRYEAMRGTRVDHCTKINKGIIYK
jgi:hypothetical protein